MRELTFAEGINEGLIQAMELSESVIVMGQLVDYSPGIFGTTKGLADRFGAARVRDFPNAECTMTNTAIGAALTGLRPVIVHPRVDFAMFSMDAIANWLSVWRFKNNGESNVPVTIRMIVGKGWGQGPQHSKSLHSWFAHLPGLQVAVPATAYDAKGLLLESIFGENPSIMIEHRSLFSMRDSVPEIPYRVRFGRGVVRRAGKDISIAALGLGVPLSLSAAAALEKQGVEAEVVDLRTAAPLDIDILENSVSRTRRLLVVDFGWPRAGMAAEIIAAISERIGTSLLSNPYRLTLPDSHAPMSAPLEDAFYISEGDICSAALKTAGKAVS